MRYRNRQQNFSHCHIHHEVTAICAAVIIVQEQGPEPCLPPPKGGALTLTLHPDGTAMRYVTLNVTAILVSGEENPPDPWFRRPENVNSRSVRDTGFVVPVEAVPIRVHDTPPSETPEPNRVSPAPEAGGLPSSSSQMLSYAPSAPDMAPAPVFQAVVVCLPVPAVPAERAPAPAPCLAAAAALPYWRAHLRLLLASQMTVPMRIRPPRVPQGNPHADMSKPALPCISFPFPWSCGKSNPGPLPCQRSAATAELQPHVKTVGGIWLPSSRGSELPL